MAEGRSRSLWGHTSAVIATILNVNRAKGKAAIRPDKVNPWHSKKAGRRITKITKGNIVELKRLLPQRGDE